MNILWFGDPACEDVRLVGGKAANLSRLARRFPVPPGFCIATRAYETALTEGKAPDPPQVTPMLADEIASSYIELGNECGVDELRVAVRSSGVGEDGTSDAFAGVHETYLNVSGPEQVVQAVNSCWASAHSPRALLYRQVRGVETEQIRVAVVVQLLIPADVSAVVFSVNPVTGNRDEAMINASWGLGESIVGGTVNPDTYIVRKPDKIVHYDLGDKENMTVLAAQGTREIEVPPDLRIAPSLTDRQVIELAHLAAALEQEMEWPVDIECAYYTGRLYLLQCRAITTLK